MEDYSRNKKERNITRLIFYINVRGLSPQKSEELFHTMKNAFTDKSNAYEKHYFLPTHSGDTRIEVLTPLSSDNRKIKQRINKHLDELDKLIVEDIKILSTNKGFQTFKKGRTVKFIGDHKESYGVKYKITKVYDEPFVNMVIFDYKEQLKHRLAYKEMFSVSVRDIE